MSWGLLKTIMRFGVAGLLVFASGCATHVLPMQSFSKAQKQQAVYEARRMVLSPSRMTLHEDMHEVVERIRLRIGPAALKVCQEVFSSNCFESLNSMRIVVKNDQNINAYADQHGNLGLNSGLIQAAGSDDEIAFVIGHEIAHVMFGHIGKQQDNANMGALLGLLISAGATYEFGSYVDPHETGQFIYDSTMAFGEAGWLAYSPEMELEADTLSAHIIHEAGYDVRLAKSMLVRMARIGVSAGPEIVMSVVGYFGTHPSDDRRLAHWDVVAAKAVRGLTPKD